MLLSIKLMIIIGIILFLNCGKCNKLSELKNQAQNKAKDYYKSQFKKDKNWHFLGHDASEYPGKNEEYKQINRDKWEEYYNCLQIQNDNIGLHGSVIPEAIQGFEGSFVRFDCKVCLSPKERLNIDSVEWYWAPSKSNELVLVEYTEHIMLSPEDKTLSMYSLQRDQAGQYICKLGEALTAPYFLTITETTSHVKEVHTQFAEVGPYAQKSLYLHEFNIMFDTVWSEWSPCSACNQVGKRHKFGYCVIIYHDELTQTTINENVENSNKTKKARKINNKVDEKQITKRKSGALHEISIQDLEILKIFKNGIPCSSPFLPKPIAHLVKIKNRTDEIMIGYCKVPCPEIQVFEVRDKQGHILETANNSAGIYSMLQDLPPLEPPIVRMVQYESSGVRIIISCPGNLNSDAPIQWQIGSQNVIAELISKQSDKRIYISVTDRIHIVKAKISDTNIYSCWQHNELAGTVRLIVEKKMKLTLNHHFMLVGMILILTTFLYIFTKAFFGRKRAVITK